MNTHTQTLQLIHTHRAGLRFAGLRIVGNAAMRPAAAVLAVRVRCRAVPLPFGLVLQGEQAIDTHTPHPQMHCSVVSSASLYAWIVNTQINTHTQCYTHKHTHTNIN